MSNTYQYLIDLRHKLENPDQVSLNMSMADVHSPGVFSLVVSGTEPGKLTRIFIADKKLKPYEVQLHTHRYPIRLTALTGSIRQIIGVPDPEFRRLRGDILMSKYNYLSPLNGGHGLTYHSDVMVDIKDYPMPPGSQILMSEIDFHTMSCSKGSMWVVEELGFRVDASQVLGVPFITDGLYKEPKQFQIGDKLQSVLKVVRKMILDYELVKGGNQ